MSDYHKGRVVSIETRALMAASKKGLKHSEETLVKLRKAAQNKVNGMETEVVDTVYFFF